MNSSSVKSNKVVNSVRSAAVKGAINRNKRLAQQVGLTKKNANGKNVGNYIKFRTLKKPLMNAILKNAKNRKEKGKTAKAAAKPAAKAVSKPAAKNKKTNGTKKNAPVEMVNISTTVMPVPIATTKSAKSAKMSESMKASLSVSDRFGRIAALRQRNPGISQSDAMKVVGILNKNPGMSNKEAMERAKIAPSAKATSKKNENVNLLGFSNAPIAVAPVVPPKKYNENVMAAYGM
jgi:hypothetical protein